MMDFAPPFGWAAPFLEQTVTDDPSFENVESWFIYDYMVGRLGSDVTIKVNGSSNDTNDTVRTRTELWVELPEVPAPSGAAVVSVDYKKQEVDEKVFDVADEWGSSDLHIEWKSKPYSTTDLPGYQRVYGDVLAQGLARDISDTEAGLKELKKPGVTEHRDFVLKEFETAKPPLRVAFGLENEVWGSSDDYSYAMRFISHWLASNVKIVLT